MATFVLIHGAASDSWYWHQVEPELRRRGHDVVAVDLPCDDDSAGFPEYADAVVDAVADRRDLIVVAQSMGSFTGLLVCQRIPVDLLVLVAAMVPRPGEPPGEWWANTGHAAAMRAQGKRDGWWASDDDWFDPFVLFLHDVDPEVAAQSGDHVRDQSGTPFEGPFPFEAWPDVPVRFLLCRDDRFFPAELQRRVVKERLGITPDEMGGGHLPALARPAELCEWLERYRNGVQP